MNILIIGIPDTTIIKEIKKSTYLEKLYLAAAESVEDIPNITYTDIPDLIQKIKLLKIDFAITFDKNLIQNGIVEELKNYKISIISVNKKWFNLETSRVSAKKLLEHYRITTPEIIKAPVNFPVIIKTDSPHNTKIAMSLNDLIQKMEEFEGKNFFIEEFLDGDVFEFTHIWDGENLFTIPSDLDLSEVQQEKLKLYTTKMNFMFSDENADFIGFFASKLLWAKNEWYVLKFKMGLEKYPITNNFSKDFLFLLNLIAYRKLNEL